MRITLRANARENDVGETKGKSQTTFPGEVN
jgi:hypothetical protein